MRHAGKWLVRLAVVAALVWYLRPLYTPPVPPQPPQRGATDSVTWRFYLTGQTNVFQELTVTGEGQAVLVITRQQCDPDIPESFTGTKLRLDRQAGIVEFRQENVLPADDAKKLLDDALRAGVFGLKSVPTSETERLRVRTHFGNRDQSATGPADLSSTFDWAPSVWVNRTRWQQVARLPRNFPSLYRRLQKHEIVLVDDHGQPVESPAK